jgi:gamma-glutamylcyclotransferase (GGCT)/AIG2-like uncharacterized protein YtfP
MLEPGLLYFAYGCNMDREFLSEVLSFELRPGYVARADGWRLAFNKGGEGEGDSVCVNLMPADDCCVYGVIFSVPNKSLPALDEFEGVPEHYRRETLWVQPEGRHGRQAALAYVAQPEWVVEEGVLDPDYLQTLLRGAADHGLPDIYIDWVADLARGAAIGPFRPLT